MTVKLPLILALASLVACTKVSNHPLVGTYEVDSAVWRFTPNEFVVTTDKQIVGGGIWSMEDSYLHLVHPFYLELEGSVLYQPQSDTTWIFYTDTITYHLIQLK